MISYTIASACRITHKDWLQNRRLDLYHRSMDHLIAYLNNLCSRDIYLCYADNRILLSRAFYHALVLGSQPLLCATQLNALSVNVHTRILTGLMYRILTETKTKCRQLVKLPLSGEAMPPNKGTANPHNIVYDIVYNIVYDIVS